MNQQTIELPATRRGSMLLNTLPAGRTFEEFAIVDVISLPLVSEISRQSAEAKRITTSQVTTGR